MGSTTLQIQANAQGAMKQMLGQQPKILRLLDEAWGRGTAGQQDQGPEKTRTVSTS